MNSDAAMRTRERQVNAILHGQIAAFQESDCDAELGKQTGMRFSIAWKNAGKMPAVAQLDKELRRAERSTSFSPS